MSRTNSSLTSEAQQILKAAGWSLQEIKSVLINESELRNQFAMAALPAIIATNPGTNYVQLTTDAYICADAMLRARVDVIPNRQQAVQTTGTGA